MDPPENSVNRIGRTIWTVWGYLSGAVARYLRPEVTAEGNQSVRARTDEESAVNKIDREVKANNSDDVNERAEVKCSPSIVRAAASVQWDNIKSDNNDQLNTKKQTYNCAAWSTGTETDGEGRTAEKVSSDEVQAEEEHAICERETTQEVTGQTEQKDGDDKEECDENHEVEKCAEKREDADDTDVMIQSEQDRDKQIETEDTGGLKDETEKQIIVQKNQRKTENDEVADVSKNQIEEMISGTEQDEESQTAQDLEEIGRFEPKDGDGELEYLTDEANSISKPERLKAIDKYSDEIADVSKSSVEEMMLGTEQDEDTTEREQDMTKYESAETLQREKQAPNDETEVKTSTVVDETFDALEDTLLSDSENTPESGTGSSVLATKTEGMFSDLAVCEFPGEPRRGLETDWGCFEEIQTKLHDPQSPAGERAERDAESETLIQTERQQTDKTELSLKQHVEFRTEVVVETKISSEDEEAEAFETESRSPVIRNVSLEPHQLLEFKMSQGTMDTFSETQGNSSVSEITSEDQTDAKPVSTRSLSPTELLEEPLDLQADVAKTALEYVEEITNQVLKEMIATECNLVGLSPEEPGDAEHQAQCVSADASVLEEELITSTVDSSEEHMSSAECVSADASVLEEELITLMMDSSEEHMSSAQCVSADASVLEEELITSTVDSSEEHMSSAECVSADASVLEEELITSTVDSSGEHMSSAECVSADASVLEEERITSTMDSSEEHMSSAQCVSADASVLEEERITSTMDSSEEHMSSAECVSADASVLEEELITSTVDSSEEHMSSTECVSADASVLEEEPITSTVDSSGEHMSSAECVSADAPVLEEELITSTVDSSEEHMSSAECVSADAPVLEEEPITSTVDSSGEHMSSAECESTDGRHEQMQKSIAGETVFRSQEDLMEVSSPGMKRGFDQMSKGLAEVKTDGKFDLILQAFEDSSLDFSVQKSRIAVKNPLIRPPKDPRKLLSKASVEPRPQPSDRSQTLQVSAPSKAMIGFKLPGLGAGLPVLRRTEFVPKAEAQRTLQTQQKSVTEDSVKQEQVPAKPKWTPPRHPGMGSPFMMAELKNKLKKPVQE